MTHSIRFAGPVFMGLAAVAMFAAPASAAAPSERALEARIDRLERRMQGLEDVDAINKLTRAYGYYVDKQLWDQVAVLFSNDCIIEIAGRGVYRGRKGADDLFRGSMGQGELGLKPGALFNHMILQGIVDVDASGVTAKARWRAFVQIAMYQKFALWSEGTYENTYVKEGGKWKFSGMHFYSTYYTPFDQGWAKSNLPNNGPSQAYPPDAPPSLKYDVFPGHYVPPFHYANPVTGVPWTLEDTSKYSTSGMSPARPAVPGQPPEPVPAAPSGH